MDLEYKVAGKGRERISVWIMYINFVCADKKWRKWK